jgi:hypothetical protein
VNSQNDLQAVKAKTAHLGGTQAIRGAQIWRGGRKSKTHTLWKNVVIALGVYDNARRSILLAVLRTQSG